MMTNNVIMNKNAKNWSSDPKSKDQSVPTFRFGLQWSVIAVPYIYFAIAGYFEQSTSKKRFNFFSEWKIFLFCWPIDEINFPFKKSVIFSSTRFLIQDSLILGYYYREFSQEKKRNNEIEKRKKSYYFELLKQQYLSSSKEE